MKRLLPFICLLLFMTNNITGQQNVTIEEKPLIIPTYRVAPADKNPIFFTGRTYQGARGEIYPHPLYDVLTDIKKDQSYKAVYVENEYTQVEKRDDAITRLIELYNITGRYSRAITILTKRHFHVWEGGGNIHNTYVDAYLLSGISSMQKKQYAKAMVAFKEALKYPVNLEVGEPYSGGRNIEIHFFIAQAYEGMNDKKQANATYKKIMESGNAGTRNRNGFYKALAMQKLQQANQSRLFLDKMATNAREQLESNESQDFFSKFGTANSRESRLSDNYFTLGLAYFGKAALDIAKQQFTKAIQLNPNNIWARVFLDMKFF